MSKRNSGRISGTTGSLMLKVVFLLTMALAQISHCVKCKIYSSSIPEKH
ncbi:hypothetical protein GCK32_015014, partial [Trichostrongylus colubriformis]